MVVLLGGGSSFFPGDYTALSSDVAAEKVFMGARYDDPQTGTIPVNGRVSKQLGFNETYALPVGKTDGIHISQSIPAMAGQTVNPGKDQITINTSGKVVTSNIVINAVSNLSPGNIKKGVTVGGVTGTWEGYVD